MKKIAVILSAVLLLGGCGSGDVGEIPSENSETSQTETTIATAETAAVTTAADTEKIITTEATTAPAETSAAETKPKLPEPILPPEALKIDVGSLYSGKEYDFSYTILDNENILVLYKFKIGDHISAMAKIYNTSDGEEKLTVDIPHTEADEFFIRDNTYFDNENILCRIFSCKKEKYSYGYDYSTLLATTIYKDYGFEPDDNDKYGWNNHIHKLPGGRRITVSEYGNIREIGSGDLLLNAVYEGPDSKGNIIYSYEFPIDENRFVYSMWGYEWCWGFGIYDFTTGTARDVPDVFDHKPMGYHDGKIYSYYSTHDGGTDNILYVTDINTLETTPFYKFEYDEPELRSDYNFVYDYEMTPDGNFLLKINDNENVIKVILYSADTLKVVREYEFKNTYIDYWYIQFTSDGKAVLNDDKQKCLYVLDLNK